MGFKPKAPPPPKPVSQPKKSEGQTAALARQRERKARNKERNSKVDLTMRELRRIHSATYTERIPVEKKDGEKITFIRERIKKDNYVPFKEWMRRKGAHGGRKICNAYHGEVSRKAQGILAEEK